MNISSQQLWSIVLAMVCLGMVLVLKQNCSGGAVRFLGVFESRPGDGGNPK